MIETKNTAGWVWSVVHSHAQTLLNLSKCDFCWYVGEATTLKLVQNTKVVKL